MPHWLLQLARQLAVLVVIVWVQWETVHKWRVQQLALSSLQVALQPIQCLAQLPALQLRAELRR